MFMTLKTLKYLIKYVLKPKITKITLLSRICISTCCHHQHELSTISVVEDNNIVVDKCIFD